jgi:hypothetical protein
LSGYFDLAAAMLEQAFECYDESASTRLHSADDIARHLLWVYALGKIWSPIYVFFTPG